MSTTSGSVPQSSTLRRHSDRHRVSRTNSPCACPGRMSPLVPLMQNVEPSSSVTNPATCWSGSPRSVQGAFNCRHRPLPRLGGAGSSPLPSRGRGVAACNAPWTLRGRRTSRSPGW